MALYPNQGPWKPLPIALQQPTQEPIEGPSSPGPLSRIVHPQKTVNLAESLQALRQEITIRKQQGTPGNGPQNKKNKRCNKWENVIPGVHGIQWMDKIIRKTRETAIEAVANTMESLLQRLAEWFSEALAGVSTRMELMENRMLTQFTVPESAQKTAPSTTATTRTADHNTRNSTATGPMYTPTCKGQPVMMAPQKVIKNPLAAHHPSCLIIEILPEELKPEEWGGFTYT
ncbi:hypothetical protein C8J57DRAFT_1234165 [Mycena rebaudengoi]|nr:hypothetical protein C8J57DRAFT_1234165 [Mycena rebaudengoi]